MLCLLVSVSARRIRVCRTLTVAQVPQSPDMVPRVLPGTFQVMLAVLIAKSSLQHTSGIEWVGFEVLSMFRLLILEYGPVIQGM